MHFKMTAMLDEETRKAIRDVLLGEAKNEARSEAQSLFHKEVRESINRKVAGFMSDNWSVRSIATEAMVRIFSTQWTEISNLIQSTVASEIEGRLAKVAELAVEKVVQKKLADKTVWEAEKQNSHIRALARDEIKQMLKGA